MKPTVDLILDASQDFLSPSAIYAGLDLLARSGVIALRFRRPQPAEQELAREFSSTGVLLQVANPSSTRPVLLAIDLRDQSDHVAHEALGKCDVYLKRSLFRPDLARLPTQLARKVRPFGLNFPCRTGGSSRRLFRCTCWRMLLRGLSGVRRLRHH
jgi:hypothetical protein